jgi:uncharacterized protein
VPHALILSGGVAHDFPALNAEVSGLLAEQGVTATVTEDFEGVRSELDGADLLVVNMLRWTTLGERYPEHGERWTLSPSAAARAAITDFVGSGGPLLALHAATICFDDWPEWRSIVGGRWVWGTSGHPPYDRITVTVHPDRHPVVAGCPDTFSLDDEVYGFLDLADDVVPLAEASHSGATHPLVWARTFGAGRVVHDALGHAPSSYAVPEHRLIVAQAVRWLLAG